jgi:hypothetical protein
MSNNELGLPPGTPESTNLFDLQKLLDSPELDEFYGFLQSLKASEPELPLTVPHIARRLQQDPRMALTAVENIETYVRQMLRELSDAHLVNSLDQKYHAHGSDFYPQWELAGQTTTTEVEQ